MIPTTLSFVYTYDGIFRPEPFEPVLCLFRGRDAQGNSVGKFQMCTLVCDPETPTIFYWVSHNAVSKAAIQPFAYLDTARITTDAELLEALAKYKNLRFNLKVPY